MMRSIVCEKMGLDQSKSIASKQNLKKWGGLCLIQEREGEVEGRATVWEEREKCTKCILGCERAREKEGGKDGGREGEREIVILKFKRKLNQCLCNENAFHTQPC